METTILSADDSQVESNAAPVVEAPAPVMEPVPEPEPEQPGGATAEPPKEQTEEPAFELDGQRYTATQLREMKQARDNKENWQKTNTQRAQELAERERKLSKYALFEDVFQKRPELLQEAFKPAVVQDFNADLQAHYAKKPEDIFSPEHRQWEMQKDLLLAQRTERVAEEKAAQRIFETEAREHNERIGSEAEKKLREKGRDESQILEIGRWVAENIRPKNGKFPVSAFDVAEKILFGEEESRSAKLEGARSAARSISQAVPASATGVNKQTESKTPGDKDDDEFIARIKDRH